MKKQLAITIAGLMVVSGLVGITMAGKPSGNGVDANGFNWKARVWSGWYSEPYVWETWKWSKDWKWDMSTETEDPWALELDDDNTAVGAWWLIHDESYYDAGHHYIPWDGHVAPDADYKEVWLYKIMKMGNDYEAWRAYYDAGGYPWSENGFYYYENGGNPFNFDFNYDVPKYILIQAEQTVYERHWSVLGTWTLTNTVTAPPSQVDVYTHDVVIDNEDPATGDFSGYGNYPHHATYFIHWHSTGNVDGTDFEMTIDYQTIHGSPSDIELYYEGSIDTTNGRISGDLSSNIPDFDGTFVTSDWAANPYYVLVEEYNYIGTPPFGLGHAKWDGQELGLFKLRLDYYAPDKATGTLYSHDMWITDYDPDTGDFTGYGGYPMGAEDYTYHWTMTGNIDGDDIEFDITYMETADTYHLEGTIDQVIPFHMHGTAAGAEWEAYVPT